MFIREEKGSAVAESAILFMIYFYIIFMGIVFSLAIWSKIVVYDAAREGARYQALGYGSAAVKVNETLQDGLLKTANVQSINISSGSNYVTVTVKYNQPSFLPLLPTLLGGSPFDTNFVINGAALFKIET
jgi:Flp pilus assembly protein TadG